MKVLALTRYGLLGASSRVRILQYLPDLHSQGVELTVHPLLDDRYLTRRYAGGSSGIPYFLRRYLRRLRQVLDARLYDLVWVEKELMPFVPAVVERLLLSRKPYIVDYDDAIFHQYDQHPSLLVRSFLGRKIDRLMRGAALVIAGNEYLAARARMAGTPRVEVLPSVIDLRRYGAVTPFPERPFTIGWIGSPGSERLLGSLRDVLAEMTAQPNVRLVLVGAGGRSLEGVRFESRPWHLKTEVAEIQQFHVGIMPLTDSPWERGKCGYKLIQCMGAGRAVIASPVGVNTMIVQQGVNGFLASTPAEWRTALAALRADPPLCSRFGMAGRRIVEKQFDLAVTGPQLADLLRSAAQ